MILLMLTRSYLYPIYLLVAALIVGSGIFVAYTYRPAHEPYADRTVIEGCDGHYILFDELRHRDPSLSIHCVVGSPYVLHNNTGPYNSAIAGLSISLVAGALLAVNEVRYRRSLRKR